MDGVISKTLRKKASLLQKQVKVTYDRRDDEMLLTRLWNHCTKLRPPRSPLRIRFSNCLAVGRSVDVQYSFSNKLRYLMLREDDIIR